MRRFKLGWILVALVLTALLLIGLTRRLGGLMPTASTLAPSLSMRTEAVTADTPIGYDPLTAGEAESVITAALHIEGDSAQSSALGEQQELLLVERREVAKADTADAGDSKWQRQADVYVYDYASDTLIHSIVDVTSRAVITTERVQGVQLPLTANEEARALSIIQADSTLWPEISARYQTITGEALRDFEQLQVKVSLFRADAMPDRANDVAKHCGLHRCAQVLLFTTERTLLEITAVVDLSQAAVVQVLNGE